MGERPDPGQTNLHLLRDFERRLEEEPVNPKLLAIVRELIAEAEAETGTQGKPTVKRLSSEWRRALRRGRDPPGPRPRLP